MTFILWSNPETPTKGGYVNPTYRETKRRPRDETVLDYVQNLVSKLDQSPVTPPKKVLERINKVVIRADKAANLQNVSEQRKEIRNTLNQIERLETVLTKHIRESQEDEDAAIQALMRYM